MDTRDRRGLGSIDFRRVARLPLLSKSWLCPARGFPADQSFPPCDQSSSQPGKRIPSGRNLCAHWAGETRRTQLGVSSGPGSLILGELTGCADAVGQETLLGALVGFRNKRGYRGIVINRNAYRSRRRDTDRNTSTNSGTQCIWLWRFEIDLLDSSTVSHFSLRRAW